MGSENHYWKVGICLIVLLLVAQSGAEQVTPREEKTGLIPGPDVLDLKNTVIQNKTTESILTSFSSMQQKILPEDQYAKAVAGAGWHEVSMPVVITSPGMYRITNDYTATGEEIGVAIHSSDVYLDGNGHTFRGSPSSESYGVGMSHEQNLSNISITNFSTRDCTGGIVFERVSDMIVTNTHHIRTTGGIIGNLVQNLEISNNTITDSIATSDQGSTFGITIMQGSNIRIEGNSIRNLSHGMTDTDSAAIALFQSRDMKIIRNEITGPVSGGIMSNAGFDAEKISVEIADNLITNTGLYGIYIDNGLHTSSV